MIKLEGNNTVRLCCGKKGCPTITDLGNGLVKIVDDYGKDVTMTKEEAEAVAEGMKMLNEKSLILG